MTQLSKAPPLWDGPGREPLGRCLETFSACRLSIPFLSRCRAHSLWAWAHVYHSLERVQVSYRAFFFVFVNCCVRGYVGSILGASDSCGGV